MINLDNLLQPKFSQKIIFHIDLNSFFASVEAIYNPFLLNKPFVVAGRNRRTVVGSASYEARAMGVKAAMPIFKVKQISKKIIIVEHHFDYYVKYSQMFFNELSQNFSSNIEITSIDECYMDVTDLIQNQDPISLALRIQQHIFQKLKLTISIGISTNKFLAKIASDMKKPKGITELYKKDVITKLWPLTIDKMLMVGPATKDILNKLNIFTIGDLANFNNDAILKKTIGITWTSLKANANGYGDDIISATNIAKSIGHSYTFEYDTNNYENIIKIISWICSSIEIRLLKKRFYAKKVCVRIKDTKYIDHSKSLTLKQYINSKTEILNIAVKLFNLLWINEDLIRLVGVEVSGLINDYECFEQLNLFNYEMQEQNNFKKIINNINKKMQNNVLWTAQELQKIKEHDDEEDKHH